MGKEALSLNANTFSFFTRNPRGSKAKDIDDNDVQQFLTLAKQYKFHKLVAHAPYTVMYSHHFRYRLEVGASCSIQLLL